MQRDVTRRRRSAKSPFHGRFLDSRECRMIPTRTTTAPARPRHIRPSSRSLLATATLAAVVAVAGFASATSQLLHSVPAQPEGSS